MRWGRLAAAVGAALAVGAVVALVIWAGGLHDVRETVRAAGMWAPLLFVLLHAAIAVTPFPRTVFTVAAGVLFGSIMGVALAVTGTALAAMIAFWLVRFVGGRFVERHAHRAGVAWVRARLDRSGLLAVMSLRLIPAVPFSVLNYASGLSGVRFVPYLIGTVLGVLPGTIAVVVLGDAAIGGNPPPQLLMVSVAGALIGLAGAVIAARRPTTSLDAVD